jgi:cbb3-type cytochrome oxidase subunit 3
VNAIYASASAATNLGWLLGFTTALFACAFAGWFAYAWSPANAAKFRAAAQLPLDSNDEGNAP